jgi:hypothetical protein
VSSTSEISIVHPPLSAVDGDAEAVGTTPNAWSPVEGPHARRPTPTVLVVLASCAGVGALLLGLLAGVFALSGSDEPSAPAVTATSVAQPTVEQRALALLAKPSTERIVFRGSGGRLLLAVGSGGRAAVLVRGLERPVGSLYGAWVVGSSRPIRAASLDGTERAVFLSVPLRPHESVVVSQNRPTGLNAATQLVALR